MSRSAHKKSLTGALFVWIGLVPLSGAGARPITFDDFIGLGRVSDPQVSPDGRHVAFVVTHFDKSENKSNSDIYLVPLEGGESLRMTQSPAADDSPRFSPDGRLIAFRSTRNGESQIWVLPTTGGEARQVTTISTGASRPMWTPDGRWIVFASRVYPACPDDECNKQKLDEEKKSGGEAHIYDRLLYRHWDHWRDERRRHLFMTPMEGGDATDLTPGEVDHPTFTLGSGHDVAISPVGNEICFAINPGENLERNINNDLYVLSLEDGMKKQITTNPANDNHPVYSPDGRYIAYRAMTRPNFEADRYRLMLYDRENGQTVDLGGDLADNFDRSVRSIVWTPDSHHIYVTCSNQGYVSLYRIDRGSGNATRLTDKLYVSSPTPTPDGKHLVFLSQNAARPYEVHRCDKNGRKIRQLSHVNDDKLAGITLDSLDEFSFEGASGTMVHGFLLKPPGFDETARYPLVYLIHGGPQGAWSDSFHWRWNYQMFAAGGYVVAAVNPRGSTGYGEQFKDEISRDWGGKVYEDLMRGLDHVIETYPFIDSDRIAAAGASYGGYMINWIAGHTDRFDCLINHDGVYNFTSFYGTTEELWFPEWDFGGTPWDEPEAYARFSPHNFAKNFKTPMLVIHGARDYRVDPSEGFQLFTALQRQGVPSKLLYFPDEGHWVLKPLNAELWWKTVHEWLSEWLE